MSRACHWTRILLALSLSSGAASAVAGPCDTAEHRAFDFWLGDWDVSTADGKVVGRNRIEREYDGCVLHERYSTERGYSGESLNSYDASRHVWHQTWVDSSGLLLLLDGGLKDGSMVMEGRTAGAEGGTIRHRITWTPNPDGTVRQHWESSGTDGQWTTAFDGTYTPR